MLIFNMVAKIVAVYCFLRLYKEMEAGAFRVPAEHASARGGHRRGAKQQGRGGAYDMAPMSTREGRAHIGSPTGKLSAVIRKYFGQSSLPHPLEAYADLKRSV